MPVHRSAEFSLDQRRTLLGIAHHAILSALEGQPLRRSRRLPRLALWEPRGVFTTLYLRGDLPHALPGEPAEQRRELRGCVGYAMPIAPLYRAVADTARAAAFDDSRFLPVTTAEAHRLEVSLSVLSPLFPISPEAVEVGRHGILISQGARRGLLLPQVPVEQHWDRETFLEQTCRKAGLPPDAWRKTATIEAFTAEVFGDRDYSVCGKASVSNKTASLPFASSGPSAPTSTSERLSPHFCTLAFSMKGRKLCAGCFVLQEQYGTRCCDRSCGGRWRIDSWESKNSFLPLTSVHPCSRRGSPCVEPEQRKKGKISLPLIPNPCLLSYCCSSRTTVSPAYTSSSAKTTMADEAVGVTFRTTTSPTARRGRSPT